MAPAGTVTLHGDSGPMQKQQEIPGTGRAQPRWGRALGALIAVVILIAMTRGAWEVIVGIAVLALLVGCYLLQARARRHAVYDRHGS
jgi:hypothetical protein